ncbi:DUF4192 domain-containing protein [Mycolicibacterium llatzerense]|uniref:DUF4192 domain-containing protein n=1 Tax=Mycolicibacterium llatzerense TaxID=280871 RepID=UPI0008DE135A|nr:DUF4192 domain-containing protein [Mycolicibacterium llatzerense]
MSVVDSMGLLIARVQSWLRIVPVSSLVMLTWCGDEDGVAVRLDLADAPGEGERLAVIAERNGVTAAVLLFVDEKGMSCQMCVDTHKDTAAAAIAALSARGVRVLDVVVADSTDAGGRWLSLRDADRHGLVGEGCEAPQAPVMSDQCRVYRDHAELASTLAVDTDRAERVAAMLDEAAGAAVLEAAVGMAVYLAQDLVDGVPVEDRELAVLGGALTNGSVRDRLYALALTNLARPAEDLWLLLSRVLPFPWRAEALVLLAVAAYVRGDGLLVRQAVEVVLGELPDHRMATMLAAAVSTGCPPEVLARAVGAAVGASVGAPA